MNLALPTLVNEASATAGLFGGNILATHGGFEDSAYDAAVEDLGVTTLRFPGGSLTEYLFDVRNPDAPTAFDPRTGQTVEMISLTEFMSYAGENGNPVTIVVPTQTQLSTRTDANGDRLPMIDEVGLRNFVQDVANGAYGAAEVRSFEIGNEYWGSGAMNAAEYGRLAAQMSVIVDETLAEIGAGDIDVVVQKGNNYDHSRLGEDYAGMSDQAALAQLNATYDLELGSDATLARGGINWTYVNNEIILSHFDDAQAGNAIDGVVAHVYSRGADNTGSRVFDLNNINETWRAEMPDLDVYITEWNLKSTVNLDREADYGLFQAHEMLNLMEEFMLADVTEANVWPLIQNTSNPLAVGREYEDPTAGGEMFAMMAETLPGKTLLDLTPNDRATTEQISGDVAVHAFAGEDELALYVVNADRQDATMTDIDISGLVASFGAADVTRLGVEEGRAPGANSSDAQVEELNASGIIVDGLIGADLLPGEILQIVFSDVEPTKAFQPVWTAANDPTIAGIPEVPEVPAPPPEDEDGADDQLLDDGGDGLAFAFALLPLLALLGLAGL